MTRRYLLRLSLLGSLALTGGLVAGRMLPGVYRVPVGPVRLSAKEHAVLTAVAARLLHGTQGGPDGAEAARWVERYLTHLNQGLVDDLRALLHLVEHSPLLRGRLARFTALGPNQQDEVLRGWERSRFALQRQGFQALKSLCLLAHYQDPRSFSAIGYTGPLL